MLRLSKKMFYATEAVLHLSYEAGTDPVSGRDIAKRQGLPPRYLEPILQQLVHANILRGVRGPKGGYLLAKERRRISVADICDVIRTMDGLDEEEFRQTPLSREIAYPIYQQMQQALSNQLAEMDMAGLCEQAKQAGVPRAEDDNTDYAI